jgi:uncharacterized protein YdhG (YjbR/CyaY superfamily)
MAIAEVDSYLDSVEEPKRSALQELRRAILDVVPEAEEAISYGLPAHRVQGRVVAGFATFMHQLSHLPHGGSVFPVLREEVAAHEISTGALRFPIGSPLPKPLVERLLRVRIAQDFPDQEGSEVP